MKNLEYDRRYDPCPGRTDRTQTFITGSIIWREQLRCMVGWRDDEKVREIVDRLIAETDRRPHSFSRETEPRLWAFELMRINCEWDTYRYWALSLLAAGGCAGEVARLLAAWGFRPGGFMPCRDPGIRRQKIICIAAERGHAGVVAALLADGRADPAVDDNLPLRLAAEGGHAAVVAVLLGDPRVDPAALGDAPVRADPAVAAALAYRADGGLAGAIGSLSLAGRA